VNLTPTRPRLAPRKRAGAVGNTGAAGRDR
jgi:hypothetical protein